MKNLRVVVSVVVLSVIAVFFTNCSDSGFKLKLDQATLQSDTQPLVTAENCQHPETRLPMAFGEVFAYFTQASGSQQQECDSAKVTSTCDRETGTLVPKLPEPYFLQCQVAGAPVISAMTASSTSIDKGQTSTLSWTVTGATSLSLSGVGDVTGKSSQIVTPLLTTSYVLSAKNASGTTTKNIIISVSDPSAPKPQYTSCPIDRSGVSARASTALELIRNMPENSWKRVNTNTFESALMEKRLVPITGGTNSQITIINAWGGFAYDPNRSDVLTFGGGHGDYSGNDIYRFRLSTLRWELAGISSAMKIVHFDNDVGSAVPVDGWINAPSVGHMYDQFAFFPILDRMFYLGGYPNFATKDPPAYAGAEGLKTGPFFFDPSKADPTKVVGTTGSAVDPSIQGGRMWENRRYQTLHPNGFIFDVAFGHQIASSDIVCKNGKDVAIFRGAGPSTVSSYLMKYEVADLKKPELDDMKKIGDYINYTSQGDMAVDPEASIAVLMGSSIAKRDFMFWDISETKAVASPVAVELEDGARDGYFSNPTYGMDYDPIRKRMLMWDGGTKVWELKIPGAKPTSNLGWSSKLLVSTGADPIIPKEVSSGGVNGKWKYAADLDVFVGLRHAPSGDIWIYKPAGWVAPK